MSSITFTDIQRAAVESLRKDLTRRIQRTVTTEYGATDCGQQWAALCVWELPAGSWGVPGPLVSILSTRSGSHDDGEMRGYAVMAPDGTTVAEAVEFEHALQSARFEAVRGYRTMSDRALLAA